MNKSTSKRWLIIFSFFTLPIFVFGQEVIHQFSNGLSVPLIGKYGREAVFTDHLLYQLAYGQLNYPVGESILEITDSDTVRWNKVKTNENSWFRNGDLRGGYLYCSFYSPRRQVLILEANGQSEVYVNGSPRGGDVYTYGWVQHPIELKRGINHFLFRVGRGRLQARLVKASGKYLISNKDILLPDLMRGDSEEKFGAIRVINTTADKLKKYSLKATTSNHSIDTEMPAIEAFSSRKVPFSVSLPADHYGEEVSFRLQLIDHKGKVRATLADEVIIAVKEPFDKHKTTFISSIDGSVQYYSTVPSSDQESENQALFLSLHGASVEAVNQANAYSPKDWGTLVAATNRRPYGFDWEDWGRWDAREVLNLAIDRFNPDQNQLYLTGHSMGGHGTWQVGVTFPGLWAAIAPSAGWYSFWSYAGKTSLDSPDIFEELIQRSANPSNTLALQRNYLHHGVYVLHGDADDNVPVSQAREMRSQLAKYHTDFAYYEKPGAGHWWGNQCVDWPPMFDFFKNHQRPKITEIKNLEFHTACPGISAESRFIRIWQQIEPLSISSIQVTLKNKEKELVLKTDNVLVFGLIMNGFEAEQPYQITLVDQVFRVVPGEQDVIYFRLRNDEWEVVEQPTNNEKGPHRSGLFKDAFRNDMVYIYGTHGSKEENKWAFDKARFDAETFWYRGNGSIEIIADTEFQLNQYEGRNIILVGHAGMNAVWDCVLSDCPIRIEADQMVVGEDTFAGNDIGGYFIYPRKNDPKASVGVIAGTGLPGMISVTSNRYFVSGSGFPDFLIYRSSMMKNGIDNLISCGYFDNNWSLNPKNFAIRK